MTSWCWRVARNPSDQKYGPVRAEHPDREARAAWNFCHRVQVGGQVGLGGGQVVASVERGEQRRVLEAQTLAPDGGVGSLRGLRGPGGRRCREHRPGRLGDGSRSRGECLWTPYTQYTQRRAPCCSLPGVSQDLHADGTLRLVIISCRALRSSSPIEIRQATLTNCPENSSHDSCFYSEPTYFFAPIF